MIAYLRGAIAEKSSGRIVIDVNGVGYELLIPISTFERLKEVGEVEKMHTYQHVREDVLQLFGFATQNEKGMFLSLISVSGIGPKLALSILSGSTVDGLRQNIVNRDVAALNQLSGVGKKTAERLVVELRDKMGDAAPGSAAFTGASTLVHSEKMQGALTALVSLGYSKNQAEKTLSAILSRSPRLPLDELVKQAIQTF